MPMDRSRYPSNWEEIAFQVKTEAGWKCEECDRKCKKPTEAWSEFSRRINANGDLLEEIVEKSARFILTVAHLDHVPENCDRNNLKAWCSVCHCRYDLKAMAQKKMLNRERRGQLRLF